MTNTPKTVHLGFEVETGEPIAVPVAHLCVTGQTQLSGKTTTLAALVLRSGVTAIAFSTKRGEGAFGLRQLDFEKKEVWTQPFFRQRAGWQFVSDILGAVLSEKLKFERSWIMNVSRNAKTLKDVQRNAIEALAKAKRSLDQSVLTTIVEYFELFMPELERLPYTSDLVLEENALNVMDLSSYSTPLQMLVIASVLEEVYSHRTSTAVVIPEAWEFLPNNRNSPVKTAARTLVRKGAGLQNFLWSDAQDLASVDTEIRRAFSTWILGVQREQNEVKRVLSHIPAGTSKPKVEDIMQLERGQFFACFGRVVKKVYVQPAWMDPAHAQALARGEMSVGDVPVLASAAAVEPRRTTTMKIQRVKSETGTRAPLPPPASVVLHVPPEYAPDLRKRMGEVSVGDTIMMRENDGSEVRHAGYQQMPRGAKVYIDDGGKSVDQQEREQYQKTINSLQRALYMTQREAPGDQFAKSHTFNEWLDYWEHFGEGNELPRTIPPELQQGPGSHGVQSFNALTAMNTIMNSPPALQALANALKPYLPANGVVKLEAREVVLKRHQQEAVKTILEATAALSTWQKEVLKFVEAKGARVDKKDLVISILHRQTVNMPRDFKEQYSEVDELMKAGWLRNNQGRPAPNLAELIKSRLAIYEPSDEEVADVIGKIITSL